MFFKIKIVFCLFFINVTYGITNEDICGKQTVSSLKHKAELGEFPWLALLKYIHNDDGRDAGFRCIGSLINSRYILTGATCATPTEVTLVGVRLGEHDLLTEIDCQTTSAGEVCSDPVQDFGIEKNTAHKDYSRKTGENDIALIRLNTEVKYTDYIQPICLPTPETILATPDETLVASGWGRSKTGELITAKKRVLNFLLTKEECQNDYQGRNSISRNITDNILCTRPLDINGEFVCAGDSGGPYMFSSNNRWYQQAIVSFGIGCGLMFADGNTNLVKYLDWIQENIEP